MFAEARLNHFDNLKSNLSKHVDNVPWRNSLGNSLSSF